jgi:hypothetical protein
MARRRMYLFERAYRDFFARVGSFLGGLLAASRGVWGSFFNGWGSQAWDILLRIAVVASAAWMCVLYLRFEHAEGRGFSFNTVFALLFIFVYAMVLLWSWKAPVHFAAKALSAVSAVSVIMLLAVALAGAAVAIFIPYLLALCLMTLLSLAVFLPARFAHWVWLQKYHITFKCPYDDCNHARRMPIHVCGCGAEYKDLRPSFYGIFHHVCRHADGDHKLATMDFLGRNKLPRMCGGCGRPLLHSSLGQLREFPIFVMGGPNVGKTVFIAQAIRRVAGIFSAQPGATVQLDSDPQRREHAEQLRLLDSGQRLAKTAEIMTAYGLAVRVPKGLRALVYFFDKQGEYFEKMSDFGKMQGIRGLNGILLLVDPFSLPALDEYGNRMGGQLQPSRAPLHTVASNLIHAVEQMLPGNQYEQCKVPLAVVLSKADALPNGAYPFLSGLIESGQEDSQALHVRCREALSRLGGDDTVRLLEQKFKNVRYFASTAMGRMPDLRDASPFQPAGVEQPVLWLLGQAATPSSRPAPGWTAVHPA